MYIHKIWVKEMTLILLFVAAVVVLDILALRYGADSREGLEYAPERLGLPR